MKKLLMLPVAAFVLFFVGCGKNKEAVKKRAKESKPIRQRRLKVKLIEYKGSQCKQCNLKYNGKNGSGFDFHHLDPSQKEFNISGKLCILAWETILKEADKCDMMCAICHRIDHNGEY